VASSVTFIAVDTCYIYIFTNTKITNDFIIFHWRTLLYTH